MPTLREAAEQALEALDSGPLNTERFLALQALRQALEAEQQDEPVGKTVLMPGPNGFTMDCFHASDVPVDTDLYTHPQPAQQPLTEELLHSLWLYTPVDYYTDNESIFKQAARAIERAHGIGGEA